MSSIKTFLWSGSEKRDPEETVLGKAPGGAEDVSPEVFFSSAEPKTMRKPTKCENIMEHFDDIQRAEDRRDVDTLAAVGRDVLTCLSKALTERTESKVQQVKLEGAALEALQGWKKCQKQLAGRTGIPMCPRCGTINDPDALFCRNCGVKL